MRNRKSLTRRQFLHQASLAGATGIALSQAIGAAPSPIENSTRRAPCEACILLWLGGGVAHTDTWDPKHLGDPAQRIAGSAYPSIDTAVPGVRVSTHLKKVARRLDELTILRTVYHNVIDEHAAAVNFLYTGRPTSGTIVYPSIGSVISHQRGAAAEGVPAYVLAGYPTVSRGPGFLGSEHRFLYITDTRRGPAGLSLPAGVSPARQTRRRELQRLVTEAALTQYPEKDDPIQGYGRVIDASHDLAAGKFRQAFDLDEESASLRRTYGSEFGQRCLLARRLVERGVRFVEVLHNLNFSNGTGWDTHNDGQLNQHLLIKDLDDAMAALIDDLKAKHLLDKTLIVVASEFGRPITFDSGGGRGHQASTFSVVLAGGGLRHRGALGDTDEAAKKPLSHPVSIPDLHATIHHALGIDPQTVLYAGDRPVPITDGGKPARSLFG